METGVPYVLVVLKDGTRSEYPNATIDVFDGRTLTVTHDLTGDRVASFKPGTWRQGSRFDAQHYEEFYFDTRDWRTTGQRKY